MGTDQYRTIFVGRLSYKTTEERLRREFDGVFGDVVSCSIVKDTVTGKSRGYGFVEFKSEREADDAVRRGDGRKVDSRRIIVDRELGRVKASWYPRRLGGGKGEARRDRLDEELIRELKKQITREQSAVKEQQRQEPAEPSSKDKAGEGAADQDKKVEQAVPATKVTPAKEVTGAAATESTPVNKQEVPASLGNSEKQREQEDESPKRGGSRDRADSSEIERRPHDRGDQRRRDQYRQSRRRSKSRSGSRSPDDRYRSRGYGGHHRDRERDRDHRRERDSYRDSERRSYGAPKTASRSHRYDRDRSYEEAAYRSRGYEQGSSSKPSFYVSGGSGAGSSSLKRDRDMPVASSTDQIAKKQTTGKIVEEREDGEL